LLARWLFPLVTSVALLPCWLGGAFPWLSRWLLPLVVSVAPSPCWLGGSFPLLPRWLSPLAGSVALSPCCLGGSFPLLARWLFPLVGSVALPPCWRGGFPLVGASSRHRVDSALRVTPSSRRLPTPRPAAYWRHAVMYAVRSARSKALVYEILKQDRATAATRCTRDCSRRAP
jgi:hypothetical protein